ncbi:MAG: MATE family efflux transporter [Clostridium sp.]|nr:MATE family efflux transporter [Clostridium sp.]
MERNELFESYPVPKAIAKLSVPTIVGMLVMIIYNMADTFFVGMTNDVNQVASVTVTMPIFMLLMSLGTIFGVGGASSISRYIGSKEMDKAKVTSSISVYGSILVSIVFMIFGFIFMEGILKVAGVTENTYSFSKDYLTILMWGAPFIVLNFSMGQIVRSEGLAKDAMVGMMLGTILNIVLDPILILSFNMGVTGASLATVIANVVSVLYYAKLLSSKKSCLSISLKDLKLDKEIIKSIMFIGLPASLNNVLMSLSSILLNNFAVSYGDAVVAALGIANRLMMLPVMILVGLCQGMQPLVGYNYAAKNIDRMKSVLKYVSILGTVLGVEFTILIYLYAGTMVKMFIQDAETEKIGSDFIRT